GPDGWVVTGSSFSEGDALTLQTPYGTLDVPTYKLRLYAAPVYAQRYGKGEQAAAPEFLHHLMASEDGPFTVETYRLVTGRTDYAQGELEHSSRPPPRPGAEPMERTNPVLAISDLPFIDGRPPHPLTPKGQQHTY